jgi:uncharacterized membrane protein
MQALITADPVVLGILAVILGLVFLSESSAHPFWKKFYAIVPSLLLCYFIPGLLNTFGIIDGEASRLYPMARDYLLPLALVLLCLSCDLKAIVGLGSKAIVLFLTGTVGVILGAPLALWIMGFFDPSLLEPAGAEAVWRGMTTTAGAWIGGGANQAAMKEIYAVGPNIFGKFVAVDVIVANIWMAFLLFLAARSARIDASRGADTRALLALRQSVEKVQIENARISQTRDLIQIIAIGLGATGLAHWMTSHIVPWIQTHAPHLERYSLTANFFWVTVLSTTFGLLLSFTRARTLEGAGASRIGSVAIYVLVATIGMQMDLRTILSDPELFLLGLIWIGFHGALMLLMAWWIKAPVFYMAVGSQANIGGAASAPVVASAFHPALAPVGVLLAVFGYALGTYGGWLAGQLLRLLVGG